MACLHRIIIVLLVLYICTDAHVPSRAPAHTLAWFNFNLSIVWDEVIYPFPHIKGAAVEVWEWISNFIPHFVTGCNYVSMLGLKLVYVSKRGSWWPRDLHMMRKVQCDVVISRSVLSKLLTTNTTYLVHEGPMWSVFCEFKLWFMFCFNPCSAVCNIISYLTRYNVTGLYLHNVRLFRNISLPSPYTWSSPHLFR